jgi:hypothetical protein
MKHNIGDLIARRVFKSEEIKLGYISRITKIDGHGYYVYFFDWDKDVWYLEKDVDHFKQVLEEWNNKWTTTNIVN